MNDWQPEPKPDWDVVPNVGRFSEYKRRRLRHLDRIQRVVELVRRHDYVVILGPAYSDKTRLMYDVEDELAAGEQFTPIYINLWRLRTDDEASFFDSLAQTIARSERLSSSLDNTSRLADGVADSASFRHFLDRVAQVHDRHIVLLIDHLQILPHDLTHRLLQLLRAAYMERRSSAPRWIDVVVAGSAVLAELSHDATSPFNMAHPVYQGPLTSEASLALAKANLETFNVPWSRHALDRLLHWAWGDSYLLPLLVSQCQEKVHGYGKRRITQTVVDQTARSFLAAAAHEAAIRVAIEAIEADPDTMLDVVALLKAPHLARNQAHQQIWRTGVDRLQLSGAVYLDGDEYRIKNEIYRRALQQHFVQGRVAHVLRMNGRWQEAIAFLSTQPGAPLRLPADNSGRSDLLEAIIQSIYAANREQEAYRALLEGIRLGFDLPEVRIYRAYAGRGELRLAATAAHSTEAPEVINLNDESLVEVRTFRGGNWALRGEMGSKRLLAALVPEQRAIGMVIIEHYSAEREPHSSPAYHGELLRFLRYASSAIENVMLRSAIQEIGRAVLSASAANSNLEQVLQTVLNAVGGDFAVLYLLDEEQTHLRRTAHAGDPGAVRAAGEASIDLALAGHGAIVALQSRTLFTVRQSALPELAAYLPLFAGGMQLGVLALFFAATRQGGFSQEDRKTLVTFADQVAIAVYNQQLLNRTDDALQEQLRQVEALRRREEQMRSQEMHDIINAVVHRMSDVGALEHRLGYLRDAVGAGNSMALSTLKLLEIHLYRLRGLVTTLAESANLAGIVFQPLELAGLVQKAVEDLLVDDGQLLVETALEEGLIVNGHPNLLYDALRSILDNGREAMPAGGTLSVQVWSANGQAVVCIRDQGQGIPAAYQARMFQPGFSTKPVRDPDHSRGRGLFTCRAIVRKHGGDIVVHSQQGAGAEVTISLPLLRLE